MKPILTFITLFIITFSYSKSIVWATKGNPQMNDSILSIQSVIETTDVIILNSKTDYICVYNDIQHKVIELQGVQKVTYTNLIPLFMDAPKLPKFTIPMPQIRKGYYQLGSVSRRPPTHHVFPSQNKIIVSLEDTITFKITPNPLNTSFPAFITTDYFGQVTYKKELNANNTSITILIKDIAMPEDDLFMDDTTLISQYLTNNNTIPGGDPQSIIIKTNEYINPHRIVIKQLLEKNTIAYNTCAILYALENDLVFDALKISSDNSDLGLTYDGLNLSYQKWKFTLEGDVSFRKHY